jgi:hypothetical protein
LLKPKPLSLKIPSNKCGKGVHPYAIRYSGHLSADRQERTVWIIRFNYQEKTWRGTPLMCAKKMISLVEVKQIGDTLGIDWVAFGVEQFQVGLEVELEHGARDIQTNVSDDDALITGKIALAHFIEFPDYYKRLTAMEKEADEYWANV